MVNEADIGDPVQSCRGYLDPSSREINSGENGPSPNDSPFLDHIMIYAHFPFPHRFRMNFLFSFSLVVHSYGSRIMTFKVTNVHLKFRGPFVTSL